jgi:hypothetical protein
MTYAENTTVSVEKSRSEIERILSRYGARQFMYGYNEEEAVVSFVVAVEDAVRQVRFRIPLPDKNDPSFVWTPARRKRRTPAQMYDAWEQAQRQRWRALALVIKAKLEAVASGITEFEEEFLAHIVLPDGRTVGEFIRPDVAIAYETGKMPPLALPRGNEE